jgi:hypothetical protein
MAEVNLDELARKAIDAFNTADTNRVLSMCDPGIELFSPSRGLTRNLRGSRGTPMTSLP